MKIQFIWFLAALGMTIFGGRGKSDFSQARNNNMSAINTITARHPELHLACDLTYNCPECQVNSWTGDALCWRQTM